MLVTCFRQTQLRFTKIYLALERASAEGDRDAVKESRQIYEEEFRPMLDTTLDYARDTLRHGTRTANRHLARGGKDAPLFNIGETGNGMLDEAVAPEVDDLSEHHTDAARGRRHDP